MIQNAIRTFFKISTQSATRAVRANVNVNCSCIICIHVVQEFLTRIKRWVEFVIFWTLKKTFLTWERLEDAQNLNKGCGFSQQLSIARRIESKLEERELRIETQQLRIGSRLDSQEDRESRVNLLLNGTVGYCYPVNPMIFIPYYKGRDYEM